MEPGFDMGMEPSGQLAGRGWKQYTAFSVQQVARVHWSPHTVLGAFEL
jgi:hypothetical protein